MSRGVADGVASATTGAGPPHRAIGALRRQNDSASVEPVPILFVELPSGVGKHAKRPISPQTRCALVEARHSSWVVSLLNCEGTRDVLMQPALLCLIEVPEVSQCALHPPSELAILLRRDRHEDFADEIGKLVGSQALGGVSASVGAEADALSLQDFVDVTGIRGIAPAERVGNAAIRVQDSVCVDHTWRGREVLTNRHLMGTDQFCEISVRRPRPVRQRGESSMQAAPVASASRVLNPRDGTGPEPDGTIRELLCSSEDLRPTPLTRGRDGPVQLQMAALKDFLVCARRGCSRADRCRR